MGVVNEVKADGIGVSGITDQFMPSGYPLLVTGGYNGHISLKRAEGLLDTCLSVSVMFAFLWWPIGAAGKTRCAANRWTKSG